MSRQMMTTDRSGGSAYNYATMRILLVSPYHGGSHQSWAAGYRRSSGHEVELLTLPARFWKWRMHGGAVTLARRFREARLAQRMQQPDLLLATDMLDLTTFLALTRDLIPDLPTVLYMHENQLTYPLPRNPHTGPMRRQHGERDLHYVFINYASMLAADRVAFNSHYHRTALFAALPRFLKRFPEYNELYTIPSLHEKSGVLPVGINVAGRENAPNSSVPSPRDSRNQSAPLILWNQRWEYDKNPDTFFRALYQMKEEGVPFRLALCGERFGQSPDAFEKAIHALSDHIVHVGYAEPAGYGQLLWSADLVISTALHEFFGISILEAIACETFPILPNRLSYPELIPNAYHNRCLYENDEALHEMLRWALQHPEEASKAGKELSLAAQGFAWPTIAAQYDAFLEEVVAAK